MTQAESLHVLPPTGVATGGNPSYQLAGTGATGAENGTVLANGRMATLMNGSVAIRFRMGTTGVEAGTTDPILGPYGRFDWDVTAGINDVVSVQAADGTSAFEASVFVSS